jgi:hypothetical protein
MTTPRMDAMLLVTQIELDAWFANGMKKYTGQAKLKRIANYLCETIHHGGVA